jgi:hypothetical protein
MRRDYVTLAISQPDGADGLPTVVLTVDEPTDDVVERLRTAEGDRFDGERLDAAFRLQTPVDADDASGVFSLSDRLTGEFVLEVNAPAEGILDLVDVARSADGDDEGCYRIVVRTDEDRLATYEKRMLLVYDGEGDLLRGHSLIPSGVEL